MRTNIFNRMTAMEIEAYLAGGRDAIFVAAGSTGAHGSMPVNAEAVLAEGLATALAEKAGALALTDLPYFYPGEAVVSSATVYSSLSDSYRYLWKILVSLIDQGFKKLFIVPGSENIAIMLRALTRDFFEATHIHPIVIDLTSVLTGAKKHDSSNMFSANNGRAAYEAAAKKRLQEALPDALSYDRLICGAYRIMGKENQLIVDPALSSAPAKEPEAVVLDFVNRAKRFGGTAAVLRRETADFTGGCVFGTPEEREQVCAENELKLRKAVDELDLEHLLEVVENYQAYALKVCEKFPRFNRMAEDF